MTEKSTERSGNNSNLNNENIPELRLQGYNDEWSDLTIGDILDICYGKDYKELNEGDIPVFGTGGIITYVDSYLYDKESVMIGRKGTINKPFFYDKPFWTVDTLFYTKIRENYNPKFIYYLFNTIPWLKYNEATGVPSLTANNIKKLKVKCPSYEEQNDISNFLSLIDQKIELMEKKWTYFTKLKTFFLELLLCNNENEPKLRFPDFVDTWQDTKLGDIVVIKSGQSPKKILNNAGNIPYFKVEQLNNTTKYLEITPYYTTIKNPIKKGSIIFPKRGMSILLNKVRILKKDSYMDTNLMTLTVNKEHNNEFLYYIILKEKLSKIADTTSIPQLNNKHIQPYTIKIPLLDEQNKITNFISQIDKKIELIEKEINVIKHFKTYLLSKMFC